MLILGLSFLRVVGYLKIHTGFVTWKFPQKLPCILFDLVHLPMSFIDFLIGRRYVSSL